MAYEGFLVKIGGLSLSGGSAESSCFIQGNAHVECSKKMHTTSCDLTVKATLDGEQIARMVEKLQSAQARIRG